MNLLMSLSNSDKIDRLCAAASSVGSNLSGMLEGVGLGEANTSLMAWMNQTGVSVEVLNDPNGGKKGSETKSCLIVEFWGEEMFVVWGGDLLLDLVFFL